jgi:hypothetical protein
MPLIQFVGISRFSSSTRVPEASDTVDFDAIPAIMA